MRHRSFVAQIVATFTLLPHPIYLILMFISLTIKM